MANECPIMRLAPGTLLDDRFEIVKYLGGGGFGSVYRAHQLVCGIRLRDVALKLFHTDKVTDDNIEEVFGEAITLIGLHEDCTVDDVSRRLIRVYDIGFVSNPEPMPFFSMGLFGGSLASVVRQHSRDGMPVETSLHYIKEILIPLAWMHGLETPACHADLKPENVLLSHDNTCVLADFGLATRLPIPPSGGTLPYQAPESLQDAAPGTEADIYSLGVIWYEMLTGRHPFEHVGLEAIAAGDKEGLIRAHIRSRMRPIGSAGQTSTDFDRIPLPSEINEELRDYPQVEAMLLQCLRHNRTDRYRSARMLLTDIERYTDTGQRNVQVHDCRREDVKPEPQSTHEPEVRQKSPGEYVADATTLRNQNRLEEALAAVEKAMTAEPRNISAMIEQARILGNLGRKDDAISVCQAARAIAPHDPQVMHAMADVYELTGNIAFARAIRQKVSAR